MSTSPGKNERTSFELLDRLHAEGLTLVVVTHDASVARRADRIILMRDGRIVRRVAPAELEAS